MKPIPPGYSEAADNAPIPGRPWWSDGQDAPLPSQDFVLGLIHFRRAERVFFRVGDAGGLVVVASAEEAAAYDAAHPLPHPAYRAGQVWLHANGKTTTVLQVTDDGRPWGLIPGFPWGSSVPMVGDLRLADCWLLHDPLMPSRAPWGPA